MAKKYRRSEHISVRKKREEEEKIAKRRLFLKTYRKEILTGVIGAIVAIFLIIVLLDFVIAPNGSIHDVFGKLVGVKDNWIVRKIDNRFYKLGEYDMPAGYTIDETFNIGSDDREQGFYIIADDENAMIHRVYTCGVTGKTAQEMADQIYSLYAPTEPTEDNPNPIETIEGEMHHETINGLDWYYFYTQADVSSDENTTEVAAYVVAYTDTAKGSCLLMNFASNAAPTTAELPDEASMLEAAIAMMKDVRSEK